MLRGTTLDETSEPALVEAAKPCGYIAGPHMYIHSADGEIGHVDGFVIDDEAWAIRYIEVATRNWLPGKKVLISPAWVEKVKWEDSKVYVGLTREAIQDAPEHIESRLMDREHENRLYFHYGKPPYWLSEGKGKPSLAHSGA